MKKLLYLISLVFLPYLVCGQCGVQPAFSYSLDGNTATFTNTSILEPGIVVVDYWWEFYDDISFSYDPNPVHTFEGICGNDSVCLIMILDTTGLGWWFEENCAYTEYCEAIYLGFEPINAIATVEYDDLAETITFSAIASGGNGPYFYSWLINSEQSTGDTVVFTNTSSEYIQYQLCVYDQNDCGSCDYGWISNYLAACDLSLNLTLDENLLNLSPELSINGDPATEWEGQITISGTEINDLVYQGFSWQGYLDSIGTYEVCLELSEYWAENYLNCPGSICEPIEVMQLSQDCNAYFTYTQNGYQVIFNNGSSGFYTDVFWDFGNGITSTMEDAIEFFDQPGEYTITLTISNSETSCSDTYTVTIQIYENAEICGYVFLDDNANGIFDVGEITPDDIVLTTYNWWETAYQNDGNFSFDLPPGDICLYVSAPYNYVEFTTPLADEFCEGGLYFNLDSGESLCPLAIGIYVPTLTLCGTLYFDSNNNGDFDPGELPIPYENLHCFSGSSGFFTLVTDANGAYCMDVPIYDSFQINPEYSLNPLAAITPANFTEYAYDTEPLTVNFGVYDTGNELDLGIEISASGPPAPGFSQTICLQTRNFSNVASNSQISFVYNENQVLFDSSIPVVNNEDNHTISFEMNLEAYQIVNSYFTFYNNLEMVVGSNIQSVAIITTFGLEPDLNSENNTSELDMTVVSSYDPNNKLVQPEGEGPNGHIAQETEALTYTINFQNTGTSPAVNVVITDLISNYLPASGFQIVNTSHPVSTYIDEQMITWTFENILLPDSASNEPESHGFIQYRISPINKLPDNTEIENTANIYFDFNEPIITNTTLNTIDFSLSTIEFGSEAFSTIYPNPADDVVNILAPSGSELCIYDSRGNLISKETLRQTANRIQMQHMASGLYLFVIQQGNRSQSTRVIRN